MNKFKNYIFMAAGFAVLAAVVSGITAAPAIAALVKAALVQNVDERGRVPYQSTADCNVSVGSFCEVLFSNVPANQRLVVEHIFGSAATAAGGRFQDTRGTFNVALIPTFIGSQPGQAVTPDNWAFNQSLLLYVDAGQRVQLDFVATTTVNVHLTLTGYLVALP